MKYINAKSLSVLLSTAILVGCGGGDKEEEFKFYTLKEAGAQQLELTVEASGTVESKATIYLNCFMSNPMRIQGF